MEAVVHRNGLLFGLTALLGFAGLVVADEKDAAKTGGDYSKCCAAIRFDKELGMSLQSLCSLGRRIEQARNAADPICLAHLASELETAEKVAGKQAKVTAKDLTKELVAIATFRGLPAELKVLMETVKDDASKMALAALLPEAEKIAEEQKVATANGERPKGVRGSVYFCNNSANVLAVYINGYPQGAVYPGQTQAFYVGQCAPGRLTHLYARSDDGCVYQRSVAEAVRDCEWVVF